MNLKGKRITFFSEPDRGLFNEEMLKAHTGGDIITARDLYSKASEMISWQPTHSITFLVNDAPSIEDVGPSMAGRVMVADFQQQYKGQDEDKELYGYPEAKLDKEAAGVLAILCWAARRWYNSWSKGEGGLELPDRIIQASKVFVEKNDPLAQALDEAFERGPGMDTASQVCYDAYQQWHARAGRDDDAMSQVKFSYGLERKGFRKIRTRLGVSWIGLKPKGAVRIAEEEIDD